MRRDGFGCDICGADADYVVKLQQREPTRRGAPSAQESRDLCKQHYEDVSDYLVDLKNDQP